MMAVGHLNRNTNPSMIHKKVVCAGFVLFFISSGSNGYYGDRSFVGDGNRKVGFENISFSGEDNPKTLGRGLPTSRVLPLDTTYLDLTRLMREKRNAKAIMKAARVKSMVKRILSYSGFFEVESGAHMFFWYFPPLKRNLTNDRKTPIVVWVQGAMAFPGEFAALRQNGPVRLNPDGKVTFNRNSWAKTAHLIYFDSPVGVGYSFFTKQKNYPTNQRAIAANLLSALRQFCDLFQLTRQPLFIAGQGYAGKTVAAFGAMIHMTKKEHRINFQGVAIGNGFVDPPNMLEYGKLLYQLGFIDLFQRDEFRRARKEVQSSLRHGSSENASAYYTDYFEPSVEKTYAENCLLNEVLGAVSKYNFIHMGKNVREGKLLEKFLNNHTTREVLHTTGIPFVRSNIDIMKALWPELLKTQVRHFKVLLENYRVLLYNGQMSIKNAYPLVMNYLQRIKWKGASEFKEADRNQWIVDRQVAGYFKTGGGVTEVLVRNAGMHVPADQPKWAQRMISNFIYGKSMNYKRER